MFLFQRHSLVLSQGNHTVPEFVFTTPCFFSKETILFQSLCSLPHVPFPGRLYCSRVCVHCPMFLSQGDYTVPEFVFTAPCSFPRETILFQSLCSLPHVPFPGRLYCSRVCVHCPMFLSQGDYTVPEFVFTAPCSFPRETAESERMKLAHQAQQMSVELEQVREQLAMKNKENLKVGPN